jgi:hypothetical protein
MTSRFSLMTHQLSLFPLFLRPAFLVIMFFVLLFLGAATRRYGSTTENNSRAVIQER